MEEGAEASKPVIKVGAICGSLRKASFNRGLISSAIDLSQSSVVGIQIEYIDISQLPMLNTDLEVNGSFPPVIEAFREKILEADSILFASPDYNYSVTAPLKNAIDWASRPPNCWADKAAAVVSAAGGSGGRRAQYHLRQIGVFLDLHFVNKPEFYLRAHAPPAKFDRDGNLIDPEVKERLKEVLVSLLEFTLRLKGKRHREMEAVVAAKPLFKVAALCGSLRKASFNRGLLRAAIELSKESVQGLQIECLDISPLPMLNTDLEVGGSFPQIVEAFRKKILEADGVLFASPEYNYSVTAPLTNAIDWASRPPNCWADKSAAIVSAGGG